MTYATLIVTSLATELATPSVTDERTLRTDTLRRLIYKDYAPASEVRTLSDAGVRLSVRLSDCQSHARNSTTMRVRAVVTMER